MIQYKDGQTSFENSATHRQLAGSFVFDWGESPTDESENYGNFISNWVVEDSPHVSALIITIFFLQNRQLTTKLHADNHLIQMSLSPLEFDMFYSQTLRSIIQVENALHW